MVRWSYLLPRVACVVLLIGLAEYGAGPAIRWTLPRLLHKVPGAHLEMHQLKVGLLSGRLAGKEWRAAWQSDGKTYGVRLSEIEGRLDRRALAHGQWHVPRLRVSGIRVENRVALEGSESAEHARLVVPGSQWLQDEGRKQLETWSESVRERLSEKAYRELETVRVATEVRQRWQEEATRQRRRLRRWRDEISRLQRQWDEAPTPADRLALAAQLATRAGEIRNEIEEARRELQAWPERWKADQARLDAARKADQQKLSQVVSLEKLDGKELTQTLVGDRILSMVEQAQTTTNWLGWGLRWAMRKPKWNRLGGRGIDYDFVTAPGPDVWIRQLDFDLLLPSQTESRERLVGRVVDWTDDRARLGRPTVVRWRVPGGAVPMEGQWVMAVPGKKVRQRWRIKFEPWKVAGESWSKGEWRFELQDVRGTLWVEARDLGEKQEGISLVQWNQGRVTLVWQPTTSSRSIEVPVEINQGNPIQVSLRWSAGDGDRRVDVAGNLGDRLATRLQEAAVAEVGRQTRVFSKRLDEERSGVERLVEWQIKQQGQELNEVSGAVGQWVRKLSAWIPFRGRF